MRKKGIIALMAIAVGITLMGGCGKKKEATENIASITVSETEGYAAKAMKLAAERYAAETGLIYQDHSVTEASSGGITAAMKEAADAGADVILCYGQECEIPLYQMQSEYKKVKFIIVDGAPRKADGKKYKVRKNTRAIMYAEEQGGFAAGYAAVKDGYKNLGFMGGIPDESVVRYGSGFVQGVNYAAEEMGLSADKIIVRYGYQGTNEISPALMEIAGQWYDGGCEVIFASGGSIGTAVMKAAEKKDKKVIGADYDQSQDSETVLTSIVKEISNTVYATVVSAYGKDFKGKTIDTLDFASGGLALAIDTSRFTTFTQKDYTAIVAKMTDGEMKISQDSVEKLKGKDGQIKNITLNIEETE